MIRRDGQICSTRFGHGCGKGFSLDELTIDHVVMRSKGGKKMDIDNLQLLCIDCHGIKDGYTGAMSPSTGPKYPKLSCRFIPSIIKMLKRL